MQDDIRPVRSRGAVVPTRPLATVQRECSVAPMSQPQLVQRMQPSQSTDVPVSSSDSNEPEHPPVAHVASRYEKTGLCMPKPRLLHRLGRMTKEQAFMYTASLLLFVSGGVIAVQGVQLNHRVREQSQVLAAQDDSTVTDSSEESSDVPSEEKPKGDYIGAYKVSPDLPRIIRIPSIGVTSRVLQVGVSVSNELMTPKNIYDTAWYLGSAKPGESGAAIIDGHYSGPTSRGVFSKLHRVSVGAVITIERGDGKQVEFEVKQVETQKVADVNMAKLMVSVDTNRPGLNLITCGGDYNTKSNQFSDRTVVYAVQK